MLNSYNLARNVKNQAIRINMKKTIVCILEMILWTFVILPGGLVAGLVNYSAESWLDMFTFEQLRFAFFSLILSVITVFILFFWNKQLENWSKYLFISIFLCILASYLPIFSPPVAYFIRAYGIYNIIVLGATLAVLSLFSY